MAFEKWCKVYFGICYKFIPIGANGPFKKCVMPEGGGGQIRCDKVWQGGSSAGTCDVTLLWNIFLELNNVYRTC